MKRFDRSQLVDFVQSVDRNLEQAVGGVLVGGAAALAYHATTRTSDLDFLDRVDQKICDAAEKARKETALAISVGATTIASMPENYEDRLQKLPADVQLTKLDVFVPDRYDLVLSKSDRLADHDMAAIEEIHRRNPLDFDLLLDRFEREFVNFVVSDPRKLQFNFAAIAGRLFGEDSAVDLSTRWKLPIPTPVRKLKGKGKARPKT